LEDEKLNPAPTKPEEKPTGFNPIPLPKPTDLRALGDRIFAQLEEEEELERIVAKIKEEELEKQEEAIPILPERVYLCPICKNPNCPLNMV